MYPNPFDFHRANSVEEAISLLQELGDDAKLIAGGHSLLPTMKLRLANPAHLIDITGIAGLNSVTDKGDYIEIGALTTHATLVKDPTISAKAPLLALIAHTVGDTQVRTRGTIGGVVAHADPAADYPAGLLALDAEVVSVGPGGETVTPINDFLISIFTTTLGPDEVVTAIRVPVQPAGTGVAYEKLANQASGYAIVGVAVVASPGSVKIGLTGLSDRAFRATGAEEALAGATLDAETVNAATRGITDGIDVYGDIHASEPYRRRVAEGLAARAVLKAASNA
jgi:carbon-monoxide dehydrogenase medium subunit